MKPLEIVLAALGLTLAVIDFYGLTPKLEASLERLKDIFGNDSRAIGWILFSGSSPSTEGLNEFHKRAGVIQERILQGFLYGSAVLYIAYCIWLYKTDSSYGILGLALLILLTPVFCIVFMMFGFLFIVLGYIFVWYLLITPCAALLRILNKPKKGIVGTVGLVLTAIGFLLTLVNTC